MRIRIIICLAEAQTHCSREGLSKCPPAFSISISGGAEILPPLLNLPFFFLIYELFLHDSPFPTEFPCRCHCLGDVFLIDLWAGWSRVKFQWENPPWRGSGFAALNSGPVKFSGVWAELALAQRNLCVHVGLRSDFASKMISN